MWHCKKVTYFSSPLPFPQIVSGIKIVKREGALLTLEKDNKENQIIELAPFPGFSGHDLKETIAQFTSSLKNFNELNKVRIHHSNPHVEFALYSLTLDKNALDEDDKKPLTSNKLMPLDEFILAHQNGKINLADTFKLKASNFTSALNHFSELNRPLPKLRIDSNGNWNPQQLNEFWNLLKSRGIDNIIDYFEEPLSRFEDYKLINKDIPFCHDELVNDFLLKPTNAQGVVYKPTQQGIGKLEKFKEMGIRVILSSTFDGTHALKVLKHLAREFPKEVHGLGATIDYE